MILVCRLKESHNVERWLTMPSVGFWRNYCFFLIWRRDFSACSQGCARLLGRVSACLYNCFPVRMWKTREAELLSGTKEGMTEARQQWERLLCGRLECDSPIFIGTKDFATQFAEKQKLTFVLCRIHFAPCLTVFDKCYFDSPETFGPNSVKFYVGGPCYPRQIFYPICNISKVEFHQF